MWFDKPMSALITPGSPLRLEPGQDQVHHECELGIVIGMRGKNIRREDALKHISGYFIGIDFTNRATMLMNKSSGADWCMAKGSNNFAAASEFIHKSAVLDVKNVEIELQCNGETRQSANSSMMIFDVPTMIADISRYQELREGDLLFTGTPAGVTIVKPGDSLVCALRNGGESHEIARLELEIV